MLRKLAVFVLMVGLTTPALAQSGVTAWSTREEAMSGSAWYYPTLGREHALGAGEYFGGLPQDSVVYMDLPDRLTGGWGYVRIEKGRKVVFSSSGEVIRLAACNNKIKGVWVIAGPAPRQGLRGRPGPEGPQGPMGPQGPQGPTGDGCRTEDARLASGEVVHLVICGRGNTATTTTIRDGAEGPQGPQGERGPRGKGPSKLVMGLAVGGGAAGVATVIACVWFKKCGGAKAVATVVTGRGPGAKTGTSFPGRRF